MNHISYNNDLPERYDNWCNCGTYIMWVTNPFLNWISGPLHEIEPIPNTINEAGSLNWNNAWVPGEYLLLLLIYYMIIATMMFLMTYCYIHWICITQPSSEKFLLVVGSNQQEKLQLVSMKRGRDFGKLSSNEVVYIVPFPSRLRDLCGIEDREIVRARGNGWLQGNSIFQTQHGRCTYELRDCDRSHKLKPCKILA